MRRSYTAIPLAIAMMLGLGMIGGCEKSKEATPSVSTSKVTQSADAEENGVISEKQLDETLQGLPEFMADKEHVIIRKADGGFLISLVTDIPLDPPTEARIVCSSAEITWSFANCVKGHVLANGCGMLQHGAGGWTLSDCPK